LEKGIAAGMRGVENAKIFARSEKFWGKRVALTPQFRTTTTSDAGVM
jgi:hypothetical protein